MNFQGKIRVAILAGIYAVVLMAAGIGSFLLRFDFAIPRDYIGYLGIWVVPVILKLLLLGRFGQYSGLLGYFSIPDFSRIVFAMAAGAGILLLARFGLPGQIFAPPRGVVLIDFVLSVGALTVLKLGFRMIREGSGGGANQRAWRVAIIGAGDAGAQLALELSRKRGLGLKAVAFFDDDADKIGGSVHGLPILGRPEKLELEKTRLELERVVIAMPSASAKRIAEVVAICRRSGLRCETVPSMVQLATGRVTISQLRDVDIEDLLGRDPVTLDSSNIAAVLRDRVVLVSGAGGSIGAELCRQIAAFAPQRLLLVDQSEVQLFQIEQGLIALGYTSLIVPLIANVLDPDRMRQILARYAPSVIFHAAAHKHVPMMETQPGEALRNNSLGTARLAELAIEAGVERFVLISTDKAINPTSVMGASKRLAEIYLQALHANGARATRLIAVRFGNVLGSSGSVVPIFKRQIAAGGPVKVTHPEVTRYFMTIPEACGLVLQSAALGEGGEIFVLDMGKPVRIVDLARQLIELSGLRPEIDIEIEFTGLRPGEKMFEEISHHMENLRPTDHPKIMRFVGPAHALEEVRGLMTRIETTAASADPQDLKRLLQSAVAEYRPYRG